MQISTPCRNCYLPYFKRNQAPQASPQDTDEAAHPSAPPTQSISSQSTPQDTDNARPPSAPPTQPISSQPTPQDTTEL